MKISFLSENLQKKISFLNHAVSQRGQLPILSNFLLDVSKGRLTISATDLEVGIITSIPVSAEEDGKITIPARNFSDLLLSIGNQKLNLFTDGDSLKLTGDKIKASFQTMPAEDFPNLYEDKGEEFISLKKLQIEEYLTRVVFSAAIDSTKPALSGILLDKENGEAILVSTDGYRLSLQKNVFKTKEDLKKPLVIPARTIKELLSIKEDSEEIKVFVSEKNNQVIFEMGDTLLVGRLIDAAYPEYQKIIPTDFSTKAVVSREELLNAIKICTIFARETANIIKIAISKNKIIISANSPSIGEDSVEIEAKTTGEENEIAFNAKYVLDVLTSLDKEELVFEMTGPLNPGVFKIKEDISYLHLIMPIRVQE